MSFSTFATPVSKFAKGNPWPWTALHVPDKHQFQLMDIPLIANQLNTRTHRMWRSTTKSTHTHGPMRRFSFHLQAYIKDCEVQTMWMKEPAILFCWFSWSLDMF